MAFLARHAAGDWGQVDKADADENELSVKEEFRILSAYTLKSGTRMDHHRSCPLIDVRFASKRILNCEARLSSESQVFCRERICLSAARNLVHPFPRSPAYAVVLAVKVSASLR